MSQKSTKGSSRSKTLNERGKRSCAGMMSDNAHWNHGLEVRLTVNMPSEISRASDAVLRFVQDDFFQTHLSFFMLDSFRDH